MELPPPTDDDVARVLHRALGQAKKDWADLEASWPEDEYEEPLLHRHAPRASRPWRRRRQAQPLVDGEFRAVRRSLRDAGLVER